MRLMIVPSNFCKQVGSFDAGYGSGHMARIVGQKKAREIWFLCRCVSRIQMHLTFLLRISSQF